MTQDDHEQIRQSVSADYARAVSEPQRGSCCAAPVQKGVAVKMAGYTADELAALPPDAVVNSFGCGNPLALSGVRAGDVVLDLGSGAGIDLLLAAKKVGPNGQAIGVDMTDEMIARACENAAAAALGNVDVRKGIIEDLPVDADSVDWVISNCVINLSPEKHRVFAEIARVLKPGGRMLVSDIVVDRLPAVVRNDPALYSGCVAGAISEADYCAGLRDAGLVDVEVVERIVYDEPQLSAFVCNELSDVQEATNDAQECSCCGTSASNRSNPGLVREMVGQVWSAKFSARKPEA